MSLARLVAEQLRQPSGLVGRAFGVILNRANRRINRRVVERLDVHPGQRVLEIGFGGGLGLDRLLDQGVGFAAGVEISEPMLRHGRRRFRSEIAAGTVELTRGDVSAIPYPDRSFDRVYSVNTIYFWPDPAVGLREIVRVLKPSGRLVLGTGAVEAMKQRSYTRHRFTLFSEAALEQLLHDAGLVEISAERLQDAVLTHGHKHAEDSPMMTLSTEDPIAVAVVTAIQAGDVATLKRLLANHPGLAAVRLGDDPDGMSRTLLHVATDWPGNYPNGAGVVSALVDAGADVNARFRGPHIETPLHWAASSNDVTVLDALLDAGADIEAPGAVIADGTPLADARAFGNWQAAHRLVQRGAETTLTDAATLGLMERLDRYFADASSPGPEEVSRAFWGACHGGQLDAAEYLLAREADPNWVPPRENLTPLDAAQRTNADELVRWLRDRGAKSATELTP